MHESPKYANAYFYPLWLWMRKKITLGMELLEYDLFFKIILTAIFKWKPIFSKPEILATRKIWYLFYFAMIPILSRLKFSFWSSVYCMCIHYLCLPFELILMLILKFLTKKNEFSNHHANSSWINKMKKFTYMSLM